MLAAFFGAAFFAAAGYAGSLSGAAFARRLQAFADGPQEHRVPAKALIAACAVVGAVVAMHATSQLQVLLAALTSTALVAAFVTDARRGIVPDALTLGPLAIVLLVALAQHNVGPFVSAAVTAAPFALAAQLSRGRGMGWGDVKLVALGGAVLGAELSILAVALACIAAAAVGYARGARRTPIAFAPYLAGAIGIALPIGMLR